MITGKRISAKEAAEFLGIPYQNISRIDRQGEYIKRYRLGHKTYVYDLDSLHAFLEAKLIKPIPSTAFKQPRSRHSEVRISDEPKESLREFLRRIRTEAIQQKGRVATKAGGKK